MRGNKIIIIDNKDSFVYNLARYVEELGYKTLVIRHDQISMVGLSALKPSHLIISPGPFGPEQAGISLEAIKSFYKTIPILGVCLGHQAIAFAFGAKVGRADQVCHGKQDLIFHTGAPIFKQLPPSFYAARYHSLSVDRDQLPSNIEVIATNKDGMVMAVRVKDSLTYGVQFHPESILSSHGHLLLQNFLDLYS